MSNLYMKQINVDINEGGEVVERNDICILEGGLCIEVRRINEDGKEDTDIFEAVAADESGWYHQGFLEGGKLTVNGTEQQTYYAGDANNLSIGELTFVLVTE